MVKLKDFISLYAYNEVFSFDELDLLQVTDFETGAQFRINESGIPLLGEDLIPGLTTKEALLNKPVKYFDYNTYMDEIEVYI